MPTKRMLVDATHPEETRVVVTSGNRLEEFDFEAASRRQLRGNIYLAKVTRVEPSLQAAFVDYGGNRHGFLAFSEIHPDYYQIPVADREALKAAEVDDDENTASEDAANTTEQAASEPEDDADEAGDDESNGGGAEQAANSDQSVDDVGGDDAIEEAQNRKRNLFRRYKIQEVIKRRQVMLVQVVKEERGNKGAALTTYLSLAGRYSVLMPNTARGGGISRKITNAVDRKRLKEIATDLEVPEGMGVILRTAGASRTKAEVKRDFEYLMRLWENVRTLTLTSQAPNLVYEEGSLIKRTIRDLYNKDIGEVLVAGDAAYREAKDFMKMIMPSHAKNVKPYKEDQPIFSKFSVEPQLDAMFSPQVTLPSGGYIVINPTEALVSVDVNSGRSTREHNIEDTAYQTNLEAADEVARQLRLRDLAGLIVIDFIDMMERRSIRNVERRLKDALKNDRARIQVGRISHFGLMEMSRQRIRFGVLESSTHVCPICSGAGIVRSTESLALMVIRAIEDQVLRKPGQSLNVRVPAEVALYILNAKRVTLMDLEAKYDLGLTITADEKLIGNHFHIERVESRMAGAEVPRAAHVKVDSAEMRDYDDEEETEIQASEEEKPEEDDSASRSSRRRRGRRGRNRNRDEVENDTETRADSEAGDEDEASEASENGEARSAQANEEDGPRKRRRRGRRGGRRNRKPSEGGEGESDAQEAVEGSTSPLVAEDVAKGVNDLEEAGVPVPEDDDAPVRTKPEADTDVTDADAIAAVEGSAPPAEDAAPVETEEKPKRKPRRRTKKADAEATDAPAEAADAAAAAAPSVEQAAPEAEEKPKRKPRRRTKKADAEDKPAETAEASAETTEAEAKPEPAPKQDAEPEAEAPKEEAKPRQAKRELPEEGIVVTSSGTSDAKSEEEDKPKKTGWWQRGFFG